MKIEKKSKLFIAIDISLENFLYYENIISNSLIVQNPNER